MQSNAWPALNAALNACSAFYLFLGWRYIRRGDRARHRAAMLSALTASGLFLASYLAYHALHGETRYLGQGWMRPLYFFVLISHVSLSAILLPFIIVMVTHALKGRYEKHRRISRWVHPFWLYVSVTGVAVYFFLKPYY